MNRLLPAVLPLIGLLAASASVEGGGPAKPDGRVNLRDAKIDEKPLCVPVRISSDSSLVVSLPERFWIRSSPGAARRFSLAGEGVVIGYIVSMADWLNSSDIFIGSVPLPESKDGEKADERVDRGIAEFVSTLGEKYKHMEIQLFTDVARIKWKKTTVMIDGRKAAAARTTVYNTKQNAVEIMRTGEGVLFSVAGTGHLTYIIVDTVKGSTSLDKVIESLSVEKTIGCRKKPRVSKFILTSRAVPSNITHYTTYEDPICFVPNYTDEIREDCIWAEDRFDDLGKLTGSYRLRSRERGEVSTLEEEGTLQMKLLEVENPGVPKKVGLATVGVEALVYSYTAKVGDEEAATSTAVFRFNEQIWTITWRTLGDESHVKFDRIALERLLNGMQLAIR